MTSLIKINGMKCKVLHTVTEKSTFHDTNVETLEKYFIQFSLQSK